MKNRQEARFPHVVLSDLPIFLDEPEGYALDQHTVPAGDEVLADPDFWNGRKWNGFEVVRLTRGPTSFYADRNTFLQSTRRSSSLPDHKKLPPLRMRK
jgi:hypothetical protein